MSDKDEILAAIAGVNARIDDLTAHIDESVNALAAITKQGFDRVESRLTTVEEAVDRIETKLSRHETRIEALEARP